MNAQGQGSSLLPSLPSAARILIIRLRSIGDIVLLTPALRLLKQWRPDLRVSVLVESRFRELLDANPDVDEVLALGGEPGGNTMLSTFKMIRAIRREKFSLCVNLHGGPTSALLTAWSRARSKAGFAHFRKRRIYNVLIPDARTILNQPSIHTAEHQASAFFWMGLPRQEIPRARLGVRREDAEWWESQRVLLDVPAGRPYAILHPAALFATKQWPPENFARLGEFLERETGVAPLYAAGPGESGVLDAAEDAVGHALRRLEGTTLGQFAAALAEARLFVGNDSGPAHMAQALERPSVIIFGSSSSAIWGPWPREENGRRAAIVQNHYDCNPCPGDRCRQFARPECILSVTFEQARQAVEELVARTARPPGPIDCL